jgi:hypothetical protein
MDLDLRSVGRGDLEEKTSQILLCLEVRQGIN